AVGDVDEAPVRMHMQRADALTKPRVGVGQRLLDEYWIARKSDLQIAVIDIELVLALDRDVDPRLRRVEVEMPRPELHAVARLDRAKLREHAVAEAVGLQRAWVHRVVARRVG